jgi:hypothetical protein
MKIYLPKHRHEHGFTLIITISMLVLLVLVSIALLSLSSVTIRTTSRGDAQSIARANARMALMMAIGDLQKQMGPDMRISAEAALFDQNKETEVIDGIAQPHWLASYNAWGNWLNAKYTLPSGGSSLSIQDTYAPKRDKMFRQWLLSLPAGREMDVNAADSVSGWDDTNSVVLVGEGSIGAAADTRPELVTRAYLKSVGTNGKNAWWVGPENHKARIDMSKQPRTLNVASWEAGQGETAEVGVGALAGFELLDADTSLGDKLITRNTLRPAQIEKETVQRHFFDLTDSSRGVIASVRSGHLKKDLSLLFERSNSNLPSNFRYTAGSGREPSIRPMSSELLAKSPAITHRHFASWTNMRHFYRMYRTNLDATEIGGGSGPGAGTDTSGSLKWSGGRPYSESQIPVFYRDAGKSGSWQGDNAYLRLPILAKLSFIYSLRTERFNPASTTDLRYRLQLVYTPIYTYWNPYNTELRIPDNRLGCLSSTYQVIPMRWQLYLGNTPQGATPGALFSGNAHSFLRSGNGSDIVFKPGELKVFSHPGIGPQSGGQAAPLSLMPGFNPLAYGGDLMNVGTRNASENPGMVLQFSHSVWGGNVSYGNTPGSLCHTPFWLPSGDQHINGYQYNFPVMYQNDWFNLAQTYTPVTPETVGGVARWDFGSSNPVPIAYAQLVLKGFSEFNYESINWAKDWRSRNWIMSPPFYFGNNMYISENDTIAHTQRIDNAYAMNFGPMSMAEMGKVVGHVGTRSFFGSGSNPFEKVTSVSAIELPTAPISSLAGFSGMRINPGFADPTQMNSSLTIESTGGNNTSKASYYFALAKTIAYQSGVTGPGIGNSFIHPMLPRTDVYQYFNNSVSSDPADRTKPLDNINYNDNKVFSDYWDHVFLLNDSLWDDYFISSLADQSRPSASGASNLDANLDKLFNGELLANSRYVFHPDGQPITTAKTALKATDGYLKAAKHLMVDGMFNVNSTSVAAWYALFAGIRERQLVYRDDNGTLKSITVPSGKRIALSRFNTEVSDQEMSSPEQGVTMPDGSKGWSGVRYLDDEQLQKLAEECVKQVKKRGPFLNYSEFINRRLSNDQLGLMGALQSAIDYDDKSPEANSINYRYKNGSDFMLDKSKLGNTTYKTLDAAEGSRFAGIPGYVIQSDLLKPIGNTLAVRDDTFRVRAYGEALDANGKVTARAWCEAVVQRMPEYVDSRNAADVTARLMSASGIFLDNAALTALNRNFGRKFKINSFRWLNSAEV